MITYAFKPHAIGLVLVLIAVAAMLMLSLWMTGEQGHFFASAIHPAIIFPYN